MTGPFATCELWLDGTRVPDAGVDLYAGKATALSGLTLTWGRDGPHEQPGPATVVVDVLDLAADAGWLDTLHVGSDVQLWAEAALTTGGGGGTTWVSTFDDPTQDTWPLGDLFGPNYVKGSSATLTVDGAADPGGGRLVTAGLKDIPQGSYAQILAPPRTYPDLPDLPDFWDDIPRLVPGARVTMRVRGSAGHVRAGIISWTNPYTSSGQFGRGGWVQLTPQWQTITYTWAAGPTAPGWGVAQIDLDTQVWRWSWWGAVGTWAEQTLTWEQVPTLEFEVDSIDVQLPAGAPTSRRMLAFSGAVSDVKAVPDSGGLLYTVTCADLGAALGNKVIGDDPWPVQTIATRADRIAQLAGITTTPRVRIDAPLDALQVSYRDVDAQPAYALLQDLATTGGGVLWAATHAVTGPFLWIENPDNRVAVAQLAESGGVVVITGQAANVTPISACDLLLDGVAWLQDTQDVATVAAVTWAEQGLDDDGLPSTTDRTVTVTAAAGDLDRYDTRRLSITTELISATDATTYANRALAQARAVGWRAEGFTLDTATMPDQLDSLDDATRQISLCNLLDGTTRMGLALTLLDMPAYAPRGAVASYYLEGGRYSYAGGAWALELVASPAAGQGSSVTWAELDPGWSWTEFDPSIHWQDLYGVAA